MRIYDFANNAKHIDLQNKEIVSIYVSVISGDEVVKVMFKDGTSGMYDAAHDRYQDNFDGDYLVEGEKINEWINFIPSKGSYAYQRMKRFKDI